jgi:hypothetical protein
MSKTCFIKSLYYTIFTSAEDGIENHKRSKGQEYPEYHYYGCPEATYVSLPDAFGKEYTVMVKSLDTNITIEAVVGLIVLFDMIACLAKSNLHIRALHVC